MQYTEKGIANLSEIYPVLWLIIIAMITIFFRHLWNAPEKNPYFFGHLRGQRA